MTVTLSQVNTSELRGISGYGTCKYCCCLYRFYMLQDPFSLSCLYPNNFFSLTVTCPTVQKTLVVACGPWLSHRRETLGYILDQKRSETRSRSPRQYLDKSTKKGFITFAVLMSWISQDSSVFPGKQQVQSLLYPKCVSYEETDACRVPFLDVPPLFASRTCTKCNATTLP